MKLPDFPNPPAALDPTVTHRENLIEADCESLERMRKVAKVQGFTIYCDESERVGGEHTAPSPRGQMGLLSCRPWRGRPGSPKATS
jgi:hypothetical protein